MERDDWLTSVAPSTAPRGRLHWSRWTVGMHLGAIVVAVVVVFLAVGIYSGQATLDTSRRNVRLNAEYLSGVGAKAVAGTVAVGRQQVAAVAANPGAAAILANPSLCQLAFSLDLFPNSHLDVVRPDGMVACSSMAGVADTYKVPQTWRNEVAGSDGVVQSDPFVDASTKVPVVAFVARVRDTSGVEVGAIALVIPTWTAAGQLADAYGGPRHYQFTVVEDDGSILSSSPGLPKIAGVPNPLAGHGFIRGRVPIKGTTWTLYAGINEHVALGPARTVLLRGLLTGLAMLLVLLTSLAVVNRRIARPLRRLTLAVGDTGPQVDQRLARISGPSEIVRLAEEFRAAIDARDAYEDRLAHQALHDPLTGLPNRALLAERLAHSLEHLARSGREISVLFLDLDRFKLVNDSLGHGVGDLVLKATATRLASALRPGDTLARFGGDEFVIVGEGFSTGDDAERFAARLLAAIESPIEVDDTVVRVTASIGIAIGSSTARGVDLVRDADTAMYVAKERGGARYSMFDDGLRSSVTTRLTFENEFRVALERDELRLVYQPKIDLRSGVTVGVEALLRWQHPALGSIPPATFIPIAEETGLIVPVGRFVISEACHQVAAWRRLGIDMSVAVNVSGRQLTDGSLAAEVAAILESTGVDPSRLCLELTESVLMGDTATTAHTLAELHEIGVQLSIDDFGTGYSSLAYLHRFPFDEMKIDRAFVHGMADHAEQRTLVTAMVAMGDALGLRVVAEGIESAEQSAELLALGCHLGQGFHFAAPQPPASLNHRLGREAAERAEAVS